MNQLYIFYCKWIKKKRSTPQHDMCYFVISVTLWFYFVISEYLVDVPYHHPRPPSPELQGDLPSYTVTRPRD